MVSKTKNEMRFVTFLLLVFLIIGCKSKQSFYHGYVFHGISPLEGVEVKDDLRIQKSVFTDSIGYFKLVKDKDIVSNLIFMKKGYVTDTVKTVWIQSGERGMKRFLNKDADTLYLFKRNQE